MKPPFNPFNDDIDKLLEVSRPQKFIRKPTVQKPASRCLQVIANVIWLVVAIFLGAELVRFAKSIDEGDTLFPAYHQETAASQEEVRKLFEDDGRDE
jgi:hypothetical protein